MTRMTGAAAAIALFFASTAIVPATAAIVTVPFAGTLASAQNNVYSDPNIPQGNYFFVGQSFSGSVRWNTDLPGSTMGTNVFFPLSGFNIVIGTTDFSSRFIPRLIGRMTDGTVEFVTGGASQGGGASLSLNLGSFSAAYPTVQQMSGQAATFAYNDFTPLGGQLLGRATIGAIPEPATWAMLIGGFAIVGGTLRRRATPARIGVRFG